MSQIQCPSLIAKGGTPSKFNNGMVKEAEFRIVKKKVMISSLYYSFFVVHYFSMYVSTIG